MSGIEMSNVKVSKKKRATCAQCFFDTQEAYTRIRLWFYAEKRNMKISKAL